MHLYLQPPHTPERGRFQSHRQLHLQWKDQEHRQQELFNMKLLIATLQINAPVAPLRAADQRDLAEHFQPSVMKCWCVFCCAQHFAD